MFTQWLALMVGTGSITVLSQEQRELWQRVTELWDLSTLESNLLPMLLLKEFD